MKSFNATIVYTNTAHDDEPRCKQSTYPNVNEYNDITMLRSKIIDLQYFLYRPDYIFVEFDKKRELLLAQFFSQILV